MKNIDKTKDELLQELDELKQENAALKVRYEKDINAHLSAEQVGKQAEEELVKFKLCIQMSFEAIFITDINGIIIFVNKAFEQTYGYNSSEAIGKTLRILKSGMYNNDIYKQFWDKLLSKEVASGEIINKAKDGRLITVEVFNTSIINSKGDIVGFIGIHRDITKRKQAEEALKNSREDLNRMLNSIAEGAYGVDTSGNCTFVNRAFLKILGYQNEHEILGKHIHELIHHSHYDGSPYPSIECKMYRAHQTNQPINVSDEVFWSKDGVAIPVEYWSHPIVKDGVVIGSIATFINITERKQAEEEITMLAHSLKSVNECVSITDMEDKILFVNESFLKTYGYNENELVGKNINIVRSLNNLPELVKEILPATKQGGWQGELWNKRKDGSEFLINLSTTLIKDKDGKFLGLIGVATDITEHRQAEEKLMKLSSAIEQTVDTVVIADREGIIEYVNPAFEDLTGYTSEEALGKTPRILKSGTKDQKYYEALWRTILSGKVFRAEIVNKKKNGDLYFLEKTISPIFDKNKNITHFVGTGVDITERKLAEKGLIEAKEKAEEMNRLKSSFLSNMSHELRTPIIGIIGFAEILIDELTDEEYKGQLQIILESGNRLKETLNLILDISKIEAESLTINSEEIEMTSYVPNLVKVFEKSAEATGIELKIITEEELLFSYLDKDMLTSIVNNLINNAIKYTPKGKVTVDIKKVTFNENLNVEILVKDTGIGISDENLSIIFEPFRQASEGWSRKFEGTGLGLTLVKKYVEIMNGAITVESKVGVGSTFKVLFPLIKVVLMKNEKVDIEAKKENVVIETERISKPSILYVEDDIVTQRVISSMVNNSYSIECTENGEKAIEMVSKKNYDIILMDINLPGKLSGLMTTQTIKKIKGFLDTPIVAVTSYAMAGDKEIMLSEGCTHYISKPFSKGELLSLLSEAINT
ncbi:MAG: PAS domain S-box protein [Ignavibacteriales bacterium]|nr:PAS domain S-box protein [Ignavibacteriales bacterium]